MEQLKTPDFLLKAIEEQERTREESPLTQPAPKDHAPAKIWRRLTLVEPDRPAMRMQNLITEADNPDIIHIDRLRTRVLRAMREKGLRRLGLTSIQPDSGVSTIAANLALSVARREELRVMLFDFNLRKPALLHLFNLEAVGPRFSALGAGRRQFDTSTLRIFPNLALSLNATQPEHPAELLAAPKTKALLDEIEADFQPDLMIFDLPALTPFDDTLAASDLFEAALLIAHAGRDRLDDLDRAERLLSETTHCLGVLLNHDRFG